MLKHNEQEALIEDILKKFDKDILSTLVLVEREVDSILLSRGINETTALEFQVLFQDALSAAGYYEKVNNLVDNEFDKLYALIRQGLVDGGFNARYTNDDLNKIIQLKALQLQQFDSLANETSIKIQQGLYKYVLSNAKPYQIQQQLKKDLQGSNLAKYSTTLANTAIGEFQQSVIDIKAQDLDGVWIYVGVNDGKTRDFCKNILKNNNYYTNDQKLRIQNDPDRKYNCRHRLRLVSLDYALRNGYNGV